MQNRLSLQKTYSSDSAELEVLRHSQILELIPAGAVVYRRDKDELLFGNQKFFDLCHFSANDLPSMQLRDLIPYETDTNITVSDCRPIQIRLANGAIIQSAMRVFSLNLNNTLVILAFYPPDPDNDTPEKSSGTVLNTNMLDAYSLLSTLNQQNTIRNLLTATADIAKKELNAPITGLYLFQETGGSFTRYDLPTRFNSDTLPGKISAKICQIPSFEHLWLANQQAKHELHQFTLTKDYYYAVTLPIKVDNACYAILFATGLTPTPSTETMRFLAILATHSATAFAKLNALENASKRLNNMRHIVQINRGLTENMSEGLILLTPDLRIAEMNAAAENLLGYASKEVFLEDIEIVLIANESLVSLYKSAQQGISTIAGTNLMLNDRHGNSFSAQVTCIPIVLDDEVKSIVILLRDLSQTEQLLQHSKQLEQRAFLGEVSAVFAHEVKNPINSISTGLQYMGLTMSEDNPNYQLVMRLQQDCQRLTHLTESTLTFAKPIEYRLIPTDLSNLIESILERWGPRMTRVNISYLFETSPEHAIINADGRAIEQVFVNLISNSIQAMDSNGGTLRINIQPAQDSQPPQYEITVADSGPGIPSDIIKHIFEPFQTTKSTGTGLGLAITKRIIAAHKGNIFVESYPGGTMFTILLPMAHVEEKNDK